MTVRKELRYSDVGFFEGFTGTGAVNDTLVADDTSMLIDTLSLTDGRTVVPVGARFTTNGIATVRTVTATQNSQEWSLDLGGATGGDYDLTLNGEVASAIPFDDDGAAVQTALEGLASVEPGDVVVTGSVGGPMVITMAGNLANVTTNTLSFTDNTSGGTGLVLTVVQDGTTTWEITFTPAIATGSIPADDDPIQFYPRLITMKVGDGDVEHSEPGDIIVDTDRGRLDGHREGTDQPLTYTASFVYGFLRASTGQPLTVYEAMRRLGDAADWITSAVEKCEPYQLDFFVVYKPPCGSEQAEIEIYRYGRFANVNAPYNAALVTFDGTCNAVLPDIQRVDNNADAIGVALGPVAP